MATLTCTCGEPGTRLIQVLPALHFDTRPGRKKEIEQEIAAADSAEDRKPSRWACCEEHRHATVRVLEEKWAEQLAAKEVRIRMGPKRRSHD